MEKISLDERGIFVCVRLDWPSSVHDINVYTVTYHSLSSLGAVPVNSGSCDNIVVACSLHRIEKKLDKQARFAYAVICTCIFSFL
jgi:hypothetical protein